MFYFAMKQPINESSATEIVGNFNHVPVWANNQVYTDCSGVKADYTAQDNKVISKLYYKNDQYRPYMQIYTDNGQTATWSANYPIKLFWSQQEQESEDIVPIPTRKIEGKWLIKDTVQPFNYPAFCGCELNFILQDKQGNNKQCHYITGVPVVSGTFNYFINTENTSYGTDLYPNALYGEGIVNTVCDVSFVTDSYNATSAADLVNHVEHLTTLGSIQGKYHGNYIIIDTPQDIPEVIYNYIEKIATFIPEKKVVIKSADGKTTRTTIKIDYDAHGIKINQDTANPNNVICKIETIAPGLYFSGSWTPIKPAEYEEDLQFVGLVNNPKQQKPDYTIGGTGYQDFTFSGDEKILYECWNYPKPQPTGDLTLVCYENKAENNKLDKVEYENKDLRFVTSMSGTLRTECDILHPVIEFAYTGTQVPSFNYVKIDYFRRYYFVDKMDVIRTGLYRLTLSVDELNTYKDYILPCSAFIDRTDVEDMSKQIKDDYLTYATNDCIINDIQNDKDAQQEFDRMFLSQSGETFYSAKNVYCLSTFSPTVRYEDENAQSEQAVSPITQSNAKWFLNRANLNVFFNSFLNSPVNDGFIAKMKQYFSTDPFQAIHSLRLYPINLLYAFEHISQEQLNDMTKVLKIGDYEFSMDKGKTAVYAVQAMGQHYQNNITKVIGLYNIKNYIIKAVENPNIYSESAFSIKLPFYGTFNISIEKLLSSTEYRVTYGSVNYLVIRCCLDLDSGILSYIVTAEKNKPSIISKVPSTLRPIINLDVNIGMEIPISRISYDRQISTAISTLTNIGTGALAGGSIGGGAGAILGAVSQGVKTYIGGQGWRGSLETSGQRNSTSTFSQWALQDPSINVTLVHARIVRPVAHEIYGYKVSKYGKISDCKGHSKVLEVHLENMGPDITKKELENIERKLK